MTTIRNLLVIAISCLALFGCTKAENAHEQTDNAPGQHEQSPSDTARPEADAPAVKVAETTDSASGDKKSWTDDELGAAFVKMVDEMAAAQKAATTGEGKDMKIDCDQVAKAWKQIFESHAQLMAAARELDKDDQRASALEEKYGAELEKKIGGLGGVLGKCGENEAVQETLAAFNPNKGKGGH